MTGFERREAYDVVVCGGGAAGVGAAVGAARNRRPRCVARAGTVPGRRGDAQRRADVLRLLEPGRPAAARGGRRRGECSRRLQRRRRRAVRAHRAHARRHRVDRAGGREAGPGPGACGRECRCDPARAARSGGGRRRSGQRRSCAGPRWDVRAGSARLRRRERRSGPRLSRRRRDAVRRCRRPGAERHARNAHRRHSAGRGRFARRMGGRGARCEGARRRPHDQGARAGRTPAAQRRDRRVPGR